MLLNGDVEQITKDINAKNMVVYLPFVIKILARQIASYGLNGGFLESKQLHKYQS